MLLYLELFSYLNWYHLHIVPTNAIYTYFVVNAKIKNGMDHSGCRKRIYEDAQQYCACYDVRDPSCSIWYPDDSKDLHIKLLFPSEEKAHNFIGCLVNYNEGHTLLKGFIEVQKNIEEFSSEINKSSIYIQRRVRIWSQRIAWKHSWRNSEH